MSASGGYDKSVKGGTKSKLAAPKSKYVQHLLEATRAGEPAIGEVFHSLQFRLKESTWTVVFKSLVLTHMLIRDGYKDSVLDYLSTSHQFRVTSLTSTGCSPMSEQGQNIADYGAYLTARIKSFSNIKKDFVKSKSDRDGQGRLRNLSVDKGLLRETESVQKLISPLIKCRMLENDDNEISLTAFRLLVADLLILFQVANEGVINVLEHYFEMSKPDAGRALNIYKKFVEQTDGVIIYMSLARSLESVTRLEIPNLQHAPTSLGNSLEEYINDPDFEQNRIQYLAQKSGNTAPSGVGTKNVSASVQPSDGNNGLRSALKKGTETNPFGAPQLPASNTGNADLLDFFDTLEPQQPQQSSQISQQSANTGQNMFYQQNQPNGTNPYITNQQQVQAQMSGIQPQYTNSFQAAPQQLQNGYTTHVTPMQQPAAQQQYPQQQFMQQQTTGYNPYQSNPQQSQSQPQTYPMQPTTTSSSLFDTSSLQAQTTGANPFRRSMMPVTTGMPDFGVMAPQMTGSNPFSRGPPSNGTPLNIPNNTQSYQVPQMQAQTTGNPFAKSRVVSDPTAFNNPPQNIQMNMTGSMMPQQTGASNPFRKSMMPMSTPQQSFGGR